MSDQQTYPVEHLVTFSNEADVIIEGAEHATVEAWVPQEEDAVGGYAEGALRTWLEDHGGGRTGRFRLFDMSYGTPSVTEFEVTARTMFEIARVEPAERVAWGDVHAA